MIKPLIGLINLIKSIILLFKVYPKKIFFFVFVFLTLLASIIEIATIASILPLIDLLIDNNKYLSNKYVNLLVNTFDLKENELKLTYLIIFTVLLIVSYLIKIFLIFVNSYLNHEVAFYIHNKVVKKLLNQNYKYFIDNTTSNFLAIIEKVEAVRGVVFSLLLLLMSLIMSSSIIFLILLIDFKNSIILFVIMGTVYILMYSLTHNRLNDISFLQAKIIDKKYKVFLEFSQNIKEIILRNLNNFFFSKQYEIMISLRNSRISAERYTNISIQTTILIFMLMVVGILFYFTALKGNLVSNASLIVFYVVAIQRLIPHAQNVYVSLVSGIKNPQYSILNVLDVLNLPDERNIKSDNFKMGKINLNSEISVQNLNFSHNKELKNIIEDTSLNFKVGNIYGLVGRSGSGKTTFFDILMGLLKTSSGDFFIDKKKISIFNNYNWQNLICYVSQNTVLTDGTFLENICYGEDLNKINNKHLLDCAEKAECLEFIKSREHGFETYIGEGGAKISGGQRQRILIARALYTNKPILLLDEATNALDKDKENKIFKNLTRLKDDKIIIAIAHNDQIKRFFDIIYKFDEKKIKIDN